MNPNTMTTEQKIKWLKSQGVSEESIQRRIGGQQSLSNGGQSGISQKKTGVKSVVGGIVDANYIPNLFAGTGAALGGLAGGLAGIPALGVGAIPGAMIGAGGGGAAGYASGRMINENLQNLFGLQDERPEQQLISTLNQTAKTGISSAAGEGLGMGIGGLLGKIGSKVFNFGLRKPAITATKEFVDKATGKLSNAGIGEEMIKKGIKGSPKNWYRMAKDGQQKAWDAAVSLADDASRQVEGVVPYGQKTAKNIVMGFNDLYPSLIKKLDDIAPGNIEEGGRAFSDVITEMQKKYGEGFTLRDLLDLNKQINSKRWNPSGTPSTSQTGKSMAYEAIDEVIKPYLQENYPEIANSLAEYGFYKTVEEIAKQTGRTQMTPPANILQLINLPFKVLRNPNITTNLGSSMYNLGKGSIPGAIGAYLGSQKDE